MAEEWVKNARSEARVAFDARSEVEVKLGALKESHSKMAKQLKEAIRARDSAEAGLKTTEKQFEDICKQLHYTKINMATEKQLEMELREELWKAREAAQLLKEAVEAEKQATYTLGMEKTQARLTNEFSAVARDYCNISWGKALDATGIPANSGLRRPESIYYDPEIHELLDPNSFLPEQAAQVSELPKVDQVPPAPLEVSIDSHQDIGKGNEAETLKGKDKGKDKKKNSFNPAEKASDTTISQLEQAADPGAPKMKA